MGEREKDCKEETKKENKSEARGEEEGIKILYLSLFLSLSLSLSLSQRIIQPFFSLRPITKELNLICSTDIIIFFLPYPIFILFGKLPYATLTVRY